MLKICTLLLMLNLLPISQSKAEDKTTENKPVSAEPNKPVEQDPNSEKFKDYTKPLYFLPDESQVRIQKPVIEYDLKTDKGASLTMGELKFTNESLKAQIENDILKITWDTSLASDGDLSIIDSYGKELWKVKVAKNIAGEGSWQFQDWKSDKGPQWKNGDHLRFCLKSEVAKGFVSMCTQNYGIEISEGKTRLDYAKASTNPRVIALNEEKKILKGSVEVAPGQPAQFLGTIKTGATYEFLSEAQPFELKDIIESEKKDSVSLKGRFPVPLKKEAKLLPGIEYGSVTKALGFQRTIAEPEILWEVDVPSKGAKLSVPGTSGGVFVYALEILSYPKAKDRLYIDRSSLTGTYKSKDKIVVKVPKGTAVDGLLPAEEKPKEVAADTAATAETADLRTWEFSADKKFELNAPELVVNDDKQTHKAYLEVYKGAAGEASLRLSGIASSEGKNSLLAEGHLSYWFNDLFGWQNYWLSKQRWGVSAKYFTALSKLPAEVEGGATEDVDLSSLQVDMRYRFSPGLWERDETVGAIVASEGLTIGNEKVQKLGAGLFWARSMPKSLDDLFNKISFLNHPKFVDVEFVQFFSALDSGTSMGSDFLVNFHGKVMWTPEFFGEVGFGMKNYSFTKEDSSGASLSTFYLTLGLGYNF